MVTARQGKDIKSEHGSSTEGRSISDTSVMDLSVFPSFHSIFMSSCKADRLENLLFILMFPTAGFPTGKTLRTKNQVII